MDELPTDDFLTQEQYEKYLELYLLNKSNLNDTKNRICVNCQGGSVEVIEDTKTLLLNCNNEGCYHFRLKLPTYYLFDDSVELIKNSDKSKSIKDKNIKKLQDKYDLINNTDQKKRDLEQHLSDYKDLTIDTTDPIQLAQYNLELTNLRKEIVKILSPLLFQDKHFDYLFLDNINKPKPKPIFVPGTSKPSVISL
jgi:hypothetical protein